MLEVREKASRGSRGKPDLSWVGRRKLLGIVAGRTGEEPKSHVMSGVPHRTPGLAR